MQGQNTAIGIQYGFQLLFALIQYLGTRKTGMTGTQKMDHVVEQATPIIQALAVPTLDAGAQIAENDTTNPITKATIAASADAIHKTLLATGEIQDTAALEAGTAPVAPAPTVTIGAVSTSAPAETPKYNQWQRLSIPGVMPTNETLKANLFLAGDALYNDGSVANAPEFYYVAQAGSHPASVPAAPTGRVANYVGLIG